MYSSWTHCRWYYKTCEFTYHSWYLQDSLTQPVSHPACLHLITSSFFSISFSDTMCPQVHTTRIECKSWPLLFWPTHIVGASTVNWLVALVASSILSEGGSIVTPVGIAGWSVMAEGLAGIVGHRSDMFSWDGDEFCDILGEFVSSLFWAPRYWILKVGMTVVLWGWVQWQWMVQQVVVAEKTLACSVSSSPLYPWLFYSFCWLRTEHFLCVVCNSSVFQHCQLWLLSCNLDRIHAHPLLPILNAFLVPKT